MPDDDLCSSEEVVEADNVLTGVQRVVAQMQAEEARATGEQDPVIYECVVLFLILLGRGCLCNSALLQPQLVDFCPRLRDVA